MFVPATPQGKLASMLLESEKKVAQERGWWLEARKSYQDWQRWLLGLPQCRDETGPEEIVMGESTVSYYIGETARNADTRSIEHQEAVTKLQANKALGKHALDYHGGKRITLDMWVTSTHNDPLTRQIQEGVFIVTWMRHKRDSELSHLQMNSKAEYLHGAVPQTRTIRGSIN